jgi:hypothetical protein
MLCSAQARQIMARLSGVNCDGSTWNSQKIPGGSWLMLAIGFSPRSTQTQIK